MHAILSNFANNSSNDQMPQLWTSLVPYDVYMRTCDCMCVCTCAYVRRPYTSTQTLTYTHTPHTFYLATHSFEFTQMGHTVRMRADDIIHDCDIPVTYHTDSNSLVWDMVQRSWRTEHELCGKLNGPGLLFWQFLGCHDAGMQMHP